MPWLQESTVQVPRRAPEQYSEGPQFASVVQAAEAQVPGVNVHESLPHCPPLVHVHLLLLQTPPPLHVLVQARGVQEPATMVPPQV